MGKLEEPSLKWRNKRKVYPEFMTISFSFFFPFLFLILLILSCNILRFLSKRNLLPFSLAIETIFLFTFFTLFSIFIYKSSPFLLSKINSSLVFPNHLQITTVLLFFAMFLTYLETKSLLSRGLSLRILKDLDESNRPIKLESLKAGYGEGLGFKGLLNKRLNTIKKLKMICYSQPKVGPLTFLGKTMNFLGVLFREILKLERAE
jgi:hypothetical protein